VSQNINIEDACRIAVAVHGKAGNDYRDEHGEIGLKSSELIQNIRKRINL
jgi:NAD(P)H-hydrate repair Nnr-like enzyme with NAD(P)H-hydrate dehydratase domain